MIENQRVNWWDINIFEQCFIARWLPDYNEVEYIHAEKNPDEKWEEDTWFFGHGYVWLSPDDWNMSEVKINNVLSYVWMTREERDESDPISKAQDFLSYYWDYEFEDSYSEYQFTMRPICKEEMIVHLKEFLDDEDYDRIVENKLLD